MPEISRFFGIVIRLHFNDHEPAHIHAIYGEFEAEVGIDGPRLLKGSLPPRGLGMTMGMGIASPRRVAGGLGARTSRHASGSNRAAAVASAAMLRIRSASILHHRTLQLTLTDGTVVERDVQDLLLGPVFDHLRVDDVAFGRARARYGVVTWPGNIDIAPETLIWDGPDPDMDDPRRPEPFLRPRSPRRLVR